MRCSNGDAELPAIVPVVLGRFDSVVGLGLAALLRSDERVEVLAHNLDGSTLELAMARWAPSVTILTARTELAALERLRSTGHDARLLVLGYEISSADGLLMLEAGANCVALGAADVDVLAAVHETAQGERFFVARDGRRVERKCPDSVRQLTERELEVLALLVEGATYQQIAHSLDMGARTAEKHVLTILGKLRVRRKRDLVGMPRPRGKQSADR